MHRTIACMPWVTDLQAEVLTSLLLTHTQDLLANTALKQSITTDACQPKASTGKHAGAPGPNSRVLPTTASHFQLSLRPQANTNHLHEHVGVLDKLRVAHNGPDSGAGAEPGGGRNGELLAHRRGFTRRVHRAVRWGGGRVRWRSRCRHFGRLVVRTRILPPRNLANSEQALVGCINLLVY